MNDTLITNNLSGAFVCKLCGDIELFKEINLNVFVKRNHISLALPEVGSPSVYNQKINI